MHRLLTLAILLAGCADEAEPVLLGSNNDSNGKADEFDVGATNGVSGPRHPMSFEVVPELDGDPDRDVCDDEGRYDDGVCDRACDRQDPSCPPREWLRDTIAVDLSADVQTGEAVAAITLAAESYVGASLRVNELDIAAVTDADGGPLAFEIAEYGVSPEFDHDDLGDIIYIPAAGESFTVRYTARTAPYSDWAFGESTLTWATNCARLFPCNPRPDDGMAFTLDVQNLPSGESAIFADQVTSEGPPYMLAWAVGAYQHSEIGQTAAGTTVHVWWLPGSEDAARAGTEDLHLAFGWLEQTLGPYEFGPNVGSVEAQWGPGGLGGMEHHPYWHVAKSSMGDRSVHVHEAVHGWFGDGIRIACWEDFVLSEGVTTYLTARAIEQVFGSAAGEAVWQDYRLGSGSWGASDAWRPDECEMETVHRSEIWSLAPYRRGAFFLREVANQIGADSLDAALASFYATNKLQARRFVDLLDHLVAETGFGAHDLARDWLTGSLPSLD